MVCPFFGDGAVNDDAMMIWHEMGWVVYFVFGDGNGDDDDDDGADAGDDVDVLAETTGQVLCPVF